MPFVDPRENKRRMLRKWLLPTLLLGVVFTIIATVTYFKGNDVEATDFGIPSFFLLIFALYCFDNSRPPYPRRRRR